MIFVCVFVCSFCVWFQCVVFVFCVGLRVFWGGGGGDNFYRNSGMW